MTTGGGNRTEDFVSPGLHATSRRPFGALVATLLALGPAWGQEVYSSAPLEDYHLERVETGALDPIPAPLPWIANDLLAPRVVLESAGEAFLSMPDRAFPFDRGYLLVNTILAIRAPEGASIHGKLFLPREDGSGQEVYSFSVPVTLLGDDSPREFYEVKADHYSRLVAAGLPGAAWFRHQAAAARAEAARHPAKHPRPLDRSRRWRDPQPDSSEVEDAYELFSGGRAVAENLRLDRVLATVEEGDRTISIDSLAGIDVEELDWTERIAGLDPEADPLAAWIPADQHGLFFPSLASLAAVLDEADRFGTPVLRLVEPRSEDDMTRAFYERQLCVEIAGLEALLGPDAVEDLALTGSDPYLRTGTDLALLFRCRDAGLVLDRLRRAQAEILAGTTPPALPERGEIGGLTFAGFRSPDRGISSYTARHGDVVVLTNSPAQLRRLAATIGGDTPALAATPEYRFFRARYPRANPAESAFLLLSDATIRRWGSPQWRIGAARRTLAAAALADRQARRIEEQSSEPVFSEEFGTLAFLTPIAELQVAEVTQQEASAYERFRNRYQHAWRAFFDPIAAVLELSPERTALDLSVLPLVAGTDYGEMIALTLGASLQPDSGDPHANTLFHWVMALNTRSEAFRSFETDASSVLPGLSVNPLAWVGEAIALYADQDPIWQHWADAEEPESFAERNLAKLPIALFVDVADPVGLAAFLSALRAVSDEVAPGMTQWETRSHLDRKYVRIGASAEFAESSPERDPFSQLALHYVVLPGSFILSLSEEVIQRAIERHVAGKAENSAVEQAPASASPWLGSSVAVHADRQLLGHPLLWNQGRLPVAAWKNLPILNEWRRLRSQVDPLSFQEAMWQLRLVCPGGGNYVWNEEWQTMESTVYGHPGQPKPGPRAPSVVESVLSADFGISFEDDGLRAKAVIRRAVKE